MRFEDIELKQMYIIFAVLGAVGIIFVLLTTSLWGIGVTSDSAWYIAGARNLVAGNGYKNHLGNIITWYPPLYSIFLAVFGLFGMDPLNAAVYLGAVCFGLIIFLSGTLFLKYLKNKLFVILGTVIILLSSTFLLTSSRAFSEPLFIVFLLLFFKYFPEYLDQNTANNKTLIIISVSAGLACLQRYNGVIIVFTAIVIMLFYKSDVKFLERIKKIACFLVISLAPLALFLLRNLILTNNLTGYHQQDEFTIIDGIMSTLDTLSGFFLPTIVPELIRNIGICVVLSLFFFVFLIVHYKIGKKRNLELIQYWSIVLFISMFTISLIISQTTVMYVVIYHRLLAPIYVFLILFIFIGLENLIIWIKRDLKINIIKKNITTLCSFLICAWLVFPASVCYGIITSSIENGAGGFNTNFWRESELLEWLKYNNTLEGTYYSNLPAYFYIITGIECKKGPIDFETLDQFWYTAQNEVPVYLVWTFKEKAYGIHDFEDIEEKFELVPKAVFENDGGFYQILKK